MHTAILADPISKQHDPGCGHPEQPARFDAAVRGVTGLHLTGLDLTSFERRAATPDELALCHTRGYIRLVEHEVQAGATELSTGDVQVCERSYDVARCAAGTVMTALDLVCSGAAKNAFAIVRPPGHHATPDRGMGFCLFNNVAIGARYAQQKHGVERVLIADWYVHHGNGTQDIFYADGSVFFFSTHQSPWYPGTGAANETGEAAGAGTTMNCPFLAGSGRTEILGAFEQRLVPAMREFRPELVMISAGFDSRLGDPLGKFRLTDQDFADLTATLLAIAGEYAGGRLVSVLEGGYDLDGLTHAVGAHAAALSDKPRQFTSGFSPNV
jgi:acetoin utilization deacetylase AcuC-like enzyme